MTNHASARRFGLSRIQDALTSRLITRRKNLGARLIVGSTDTDEGHRLIELEYPIDPQVRWGHGRPPNPHVAEVLAARNRSYAETLGVIARYRDDLAAIPVEASAAGAREPFWDNGWFGGLDAAALYAFVRSRAPRRYVEIGSGNSTRFVRRAITDASLDTVICSIDPAPRAEIDELCDELQRCPLERADLAVFSELGEGDMILFDGSHRVFQGSDVTVLFLEVLPSLAPGVLVGFDDIYLPADYPPHWRMRHYSEQYMLAAALLAPGADVDVALPGYHVIESGAFRDELDALWWPAMPARLRDSSSFWYRA